MTDYDLDDLRAQGCAILVLGAVLVAAVVAVASALAWVGWRVMS